MGFCIIDWMRMEFATFAETLPLAHPIGKKSKLRMK